METPPKITVAMPVFNGGHHLRASVASIIAQTETAWELLLIDDGSTDNAVKEIALGADSRIHVICDGKNRGLATRLNQAIDIAKGQYLARMDHDDIAHPERFARQLSALQSNASLDLVACRCLTLSDGGEITGMLPSRLTHREICQRPWLGFYMPHPAWMGRIEWYRANRYATPAPLLCEDQELLLRSHASSRFGCIPDVLMAYRVRDRFELSKLLRTRWAQYGFQKEYFSRNRQPVECFLALLAVFGRIGRDIVRVTCQNFRSGSSPTHSEPDISAESLQEWRRIINSLPGAEARRR